MLATLPQPATVLPTLLDSKIEVHMIDVFQGPRHTRLRQLWEAIFEHEQEWVVPRIFHNTEGLSHAACYERMWRVPITSDLRLFTEFDFLPDLRRRQGGWTGVEYIKHHQALALPYQTRHPQTKHLVRHRGKAAAWFVLLRPARIDCDLRFEGTPDPCNQLGDFIDVRVMPPGNDCWPIHFGIQYPFGVHLFWSRHLHDPPNRIVSGCNLGEIQRKHDYAVTRWIGEQPLSYQDLLKEKYPDALVPPNSR